MSNKKCYICGKENLSKNEVGLTRKLINRDSRYFFCIDCLAEHLNIEKGQLLSMIEQFKEEGCTLF
jgi:uncharacterized protein YlaI